MNFSAYKSRTAESSISFPKLESWNPMTQVATIAAQVNGKRVLCRVSSTVLAKIFSPSEDGPMKLVLKHRLRIEAAARRLIEREAFEQDGSILMGLQDFDEFL